MKAKIFPFLFLMMCFLLHIDNVQSIEVPVTPTDYASAYSSANDGDVLLLATGNYTTAIKIPSQKTITLKAAADAHPVVKFEITADAGITGGGLVLDGLTIDREADNLIYTQQANDIALISVKNCTLQNIKRCFLRSSVSGTIDEISFENCIIRNCGASGYNFIYPKHILKRITVKNSTLYNYTGGESLVYANASSSGNVFEFLFENNTVYKWAKSSDRALCNTGNNYSANSIYTFRNNIITEPGVSGQTPKLLTATGGKVTGENNLIVNYGGYNVSNAVSQTISDITLESLGLASIGFPAPDNGDFTIVSTSPLATAGKDGSPMGDPRWIKQVSQPVAFSATVSPANAGTVTPSNAQYESGEPVSVSASAHFGYTFKEWQNISGVTLSTENPFDFSITTDTAVIAIFDTKPTCNFTVNAAGSQWGKVQLSPEPTNGKYEAGTIVTATIIPNAVTTFMQWDNESTSLTREIQVTADTTITATFDEIPFIAGWDLATAEPRNNRSGDYYAQAGNTGMLYMYESGGVSTTNWGANTKTFGGVTYPSARRYTTEANILTSPRFFEAKFSTAGYKNILVKSMIGADNGCVHKIQKMQYAIGDKNFKDLKSIDISSDYTQRWIDCNETLPAEAEGQNEVYIRWTPDITSDLLGSASGQTEGFYLTNIFVYADEEIVPDAEAPQLISSVPAENSVSASVNGSIVLSFNERVQVGVGDITLNEQTLTGVFGTKTATFNYSKLQYNTPYTFVVPAGALKDMSGNDFAGITIHFTTMNRQQPLARLFDFVVAKDGSGNGTTVQSALDAAPTNGSKFLIFIKNGLYEEGLTIPSNKSNISLIGQSSDVILSSDITGVSNGTLKIGAGNIYLENLTIQNTIGDNGVAPALNDAGQYNAYKKVTVKSYQDSQVTGNDAIQYFRDCRIEGTVDFICGGGNIFYDNCLLYCVGRANGDVITAPSTLASTLWGYVFSNCTIDGDATTQNNQYKLGRPWKNAPRSVFINTTMNILPHAEGWTDMGSEPPALFAEYNSMNSSGNAIDLNNRKKDYYNSSSYIGSSDKTVLTDVEAAEYTIENVIKAGINWEPLVLTEAPEAPVISAGQNSISWPKVDYAICYVILKNGEVTGFTTDNQYAINENATYSVQAVAERGALSDLSNAVSIETSLGQLQTSGISYTMNAGRLFIRNIQENAVIEVFNILGRKTYSALSVSDTHTVEIKEHSIVRIVDSGKVTTLKVLR